MRHDKLIEPPSGFYAKQSGDLLFGNRRLDLADS
jgi:hypothetical protein